MRSTVLTDDDVRRVLPMSAAVDRIESALREHAEGTIVAPPRFQVDVAKGALIFTAGAVTHYELVIANGGQSVELLRTDSPVLSGTQTRQ